MAITLACSTSTSRFSLLAIELRQAILKQLPNIETLGIALKAEKSLEDAFWESESSILDDILHKSIPIEIIPEVLAVLESHPLNEKTWRSQGTAIMDDYFKRHALKTGERVNWRFDDARYISSFHNTIEYFVQDYISSCLSACSTTYYSDKKAAPTSETEILRMVIAFYRFEICCNLFRGYGKGNFTPREKRLFLTRFAYFELEQLACVYEYLSDKISPGTVSIHTPSKKEDADSVLCAV